MLARARAGCLHGLEVRGVDVEVHLTGGLPGFDLVGLPETAVREARVRVRAALTQSGFDLPALRVVLSLAPAELRKRGAALDLPIAVALLAATGRCAPNRLEETLLFGELSLGGELRPSRGLLPQLRAARARGLTGAVVPLAQLDEGGWIEGLDVRGAPDLASVVAFLEGRQDLAVTTGRPPAAAPLAGAVDLAEVHGQAAARRALEVAAVGDHHLLLVGPPGAGKTMLARRLPTILPPATGEEVLEVAMVRSAAGMRAGPVQRPFRAPHHTASAAALIGGGDPVRPGEVTLAHRGVLFLDELPEFSRPAIEAFRTVLERKRAVVVRARHRVEMPADCLVVGAMNPCPCGYAGHPRRTCRCPPSRVDAYQGRVSGPIRDRFEVRVELPPVELPSLRDLPRGEASATVRRRVVEARAVLRDRPPVRALAAALAELPPPAQALLERAGARLGLTLRGVAAALRVARSIAALDGRAEARTDDLAEALTYRVAS